MKTYAEFIQKSKENNKLTVSLYKNESAVFVLHYFVYWGVSV